MRQTRSSSRQPSAGPSRRPKPRGRANIVEEIIELSDSDEEASIALPPRKRQRVADVAADIIDLTFVDTGSSRASTMRESSVDIRDAGEQFEINRAKIQDKAFSDLTNEQNRQELPLNPMPFITPVASEVEKTLVKPLDRYLSQVLEVVPDVQPEHARSLLAQHQASYGDNVVATVLHLLLEQPYPKVERNKGKRKREDDDSGGQHVKVATKDYGCKDRAFEGGNHYAEISLNQLTIDFPRIPLPHIRQILHLNNSLYAPTYLMLREQLKENPLPFKLKTTATRPAGKGKHHNAEFERELAWLLQTLQDKGTKDDGAPQQEDDDGECEDGIECGCCFSTYIFDKMVQCPDAHLFCTRCMTSYVENQLGQHDPNISCMDQSGCKLTFADAELKRFLSRKLLDLYERVKQTKEIEAAELDGLEECPFCEYKVVIENPEEKLFRCERDECSAVSCRACKKLDHLPKSCKEAEDDNGLNARHKVEEAMTEALMRNCPKCKKGFIKEGGCNKMSCPNCRTLSCYVCRQVIKGYDHFDPRPPGRNHGQGSDSKQKCLLWDSVEQRHDQEVAAAREKAIKELEGADPEVDKKQLEVELPKTVPAAVTRAGQGHAHGHHLLAGLPQGLMPAMPAGVAHYPLAFENNPAQLMHRLGINIGLQLDPIMHAMPQYIQQHYQPQPQAIDLAAQQADLAARRTAVQQQNLEIMREVEERQERVRQRFEAYRQRIDAHMQVMHNARAPLHFGAAQLPAAQPFMPHAPAPVPARQYDLMERLQLVPAAAAVQPQAAPAAHARPVRGAARRR